MRAVEIKNKSLSLCERPVPSPQENEALIKVKAIGVNRPDLLQVAGHYPPPEGISDLPGLEVSGIIEHGNGDFKKGDRVMALLAGGGYTEYAVAPLGQIIKMPENWSFEEAAALPETLFTVWANCGEHINKDTKILVHGGSSGIGHIAIQMVKYFGGTIAVTVGTPEKEAFCRALGADVVINYKTQNFKEMIEETWGQAPLTDILDMVGAPYFNDHIALLQKGGRHVTIAMLEGAKAELDLRAVLKKHLTITGSTLRPRSLQEKENLRDAIVKNLGGALSEKAIIPHIWKEFSLQDAQKAHDAMKQSAHMGKIVLIP